MGPSIRMGIRCGSQGSAALQRAAARGAELQQALHRRLLPALVHGQVLESLPRAWLQL